MYLYFIFLLSEIALILISNLIIILLKMRDLHIFISCSTLLKLTYEIVTIIICSVAQFNGNFYPHTKEHEHNSRVALRIV